MRLDIIEDIIGEERQRETEKKKVRKRKEEEKTEREREGGGGGGVICSLECVDMEHEKESVRILEMIETG